MARFLTTKVQLTAYRLMIRRIEQAFIRNDVQLTASPFSAQTVAFSVGMVVAGVVVAFGLLLSVIQPRADQKSADIIITNSSGPYVMFGERLHPVTNLASARLIVGKPEVAKIVKEAALAKHPRGLLMGIVSAPNNFTLRTDDIAMWTVCDQHTEASTLSLMRDSDMTTTLFAGKDALSEAVTDQPDNEAVLAKQVGHPDRLWVLYMQRKAEVYSEDQATKHALGISPEMEKRAIPVSQGLMDAINPAPALTIPYIPDRGVVNPMIPTVLTGDVIVTKDSSGNRVYHVALTSGVERITEFLAQLLENTGSSVVTDISSERLSSLPKVSDIDISRYPNRAPKFTNPHVLCWKWSRGATDLSASVSILTGESLPVKSRNQEDVVPLSPPTGSIVQATHAFTAPGRGWFVRVTGDAPQSQAREQLMWIDDTGVRYFLGLIDGKYDKTVESLGINSREPLLIPWGIAKLYAQGSTLSREDALTLHINVPTDIHQQAIPDRDRPEQTETAVS
jgi:type VII secretion protein EccB